MSPKEVVTQYIDAKIAWTKCKGKHMRQLCSRCWKLADCPVYEGYCDAWRELQALGKESDESIKRN